jgi:hypothetical protein
MIRAMLIAHADSLTDTDEVPPVHAGVDRLDNSGLSHSPSLPQGWGRVNLDSLFQEQIDGQNKVPVLAFDQDTHLFTGCGQAWSQQIEFAVPDKDLIVVMVYTDRAAEPGATGLNVNELDLQVAKFVFSGDGPTFWGNNFDADSWYSKNFANEPPTVYAVKDRKNTVEVVRVHNPGSVFTDWFTVEIKAFSVTAPAIGNNDPNQDFALYIFNAVPRV